MATSKISRAPFPSYPQLILQAIEALHEPNGSNKTSISKYIESKYGDVPAGHTTLLSYHLNQMKTTGELIFWKNNYTKPDPNAPPRRGRGRPPKTRDPLTINTAYLSGKSPDEPVAPITPNATTSNVRPRGRPRKTTHSSTGEISGRGRTPVLTGRPRGRGRPRKVKDHTSNLQAEVSVE